MQNKFDSTSKLTADLKLKSESQKTYQFYFLLCLTVLACVLFRNSDLDFWAAKKFYHPENLTDFWPEQNNKLWLFFYHAAPWLTGILMLGSLAVLVTSIFKTSLLKFRKHAAFVFLVIALGPGLVVNSVFKPYWGRPRPREVVELGGHQKYQEFFRPNFGGGGKSFPCGHCSVGFSYGLLFWIFLRRKKKMAYLSLVASIAFGFLMGIGRIAAGGHFFSDVVWAGLMVYWVCFWLYHHALKIPSRELADQTASANREIVNAANLTSNSFLNTTRDNTTNAKSRSLEIILYASLAFITVTTLLLASPFNKEINLRLQAQQIETLILNVDDSNIDFKIDASDAAMASAFTAQGEVKGFGFPNNKVKVACERIESKTICEIKKVGFFSDFESNLKVSINPNLVHHFQLQLKKGKIYRDENSPLPEGYQLQ